MYNGIPIIPLVPSGFEFHEDYSGNIAANLPEEIIPESNMTIREFLNHLGSLNDEQKFSYDIFDRSGGVYNGEVIGIKYCGRRILRSIAHYLRSLHKKSWHCGDLFCRVHIDSTRMTVSFPYRPQTGNFLEGIRKDTTDFRLLVAQLMKNTINLDEEPLPADLIFFFSGIFLAGLESQNLETVKDHSFLQLFHPATFNAADRNNFIQAVGEYRNQNVDEFYYNTKLDHADYCLSNWMSSFSDQDKTLRSLMKGSLHNSKLSRVAPKNHCGSIPWFLRSVHHHFLEHEIQNCKMHHPPRSPRSHKEIDEAVTNLFPGVYSKVLDAVIRNLYEKRIHFKDGFAAIMENGPYGFKSNPYWYVNL